MPVQPVPVRKPSVAYLSPDGQPGQQVHVVRQPHHHLGDGLRVAAPGHFAAAQLRVHQRGVHLLRPHQDAQPFVPEVPVGLLHPRGCPFCPHQVQSAFHVPLSPAVAVGQAAAQVGTVLQAAQPLQVAHLPQGRAVARMHRRTEFHKTFHTGLFRLLGRSVQGEQTQAAAHYSIFDRLVHFFILLHGFRAQK